jgi:transposase
VGQFGSRAYGGTPHCCFEHAEQNLFNLSMPLCAGAEEPTMERVHQCCCGIDVHKATLTACVRVHGPGGELAQATRSFGTTSDELLSLHDWLSMHHVTHVAMEATGVYWKPVFYVLEQDFTVLLVNPADVKRLPGRKTDVSDAAWLAQLLEHGLLRPSFIPPRPIRELRDLVRYRTELKHDHTRVANRLHKILQDADLKLSSVMSDILGVSGRQIIQRLAAGQRDPAALAELARGRLRAKLPELRQALSGRFSDHHAFLISQTLTELDNLEESMSRLAERVEQQLVPFAQQIEQLSTIPGVKHLAATAILAEIGSDMSCFPDSAHLASWAGMAPGNHESAGKRRRTKARHGNRWLRTMLVECGQAAGHTRNTALAAIYRRMIIRGGRKYAAFVTGRHILNIAYHLLTEHTTYTELGPSFFEQRRIEQLKRRCLDQLRNLGFQANLTPLPKVA